MSHYIQVIEVTDIYQEVFMKFHDELSRTQGENNDILDRPELLDSIFTNTVFELLATPKIYNGDLSEDIEFLSTAASGAIENERTGYEYGPGYDAMYSCQSVLEKLYFKLKTVLRPHNFIEIGGPDSNFDIELEQDDYDNWKLIFKVPTVSYCSTPMSLVSESLDSDSYIETHNVTSLVDFMGNVIKQSPQIPFDISKGLVYNGVANFTITILEYICSIIDIDEVTPDSVVDACLSTLCEIVGSNTFNTHTPRDLLEVVIKDFILNNEFITQTIYNFVRTKIGKDKYIASWGSTNKSILIHVNFKN